MKAVFPQRNKTLPESLDDALDVLLYPALEVGYLPVWTGMRGHQYML